MSELGRLTSEAPLALRSESQREIEARLFEWGVPAETDEGLELIERGALEGIEARNVVLRIDHLDPAAGRAVAIEERSDGPYGIFRAARTARGDEALALVTPGADGEEAIYRHVSVGFERAPFDEYRQINGRRVGVRRRLALREASITWRPAHLGADIVAVRSAEKGIRTVGDQDQTQDQAPPAPSPQPAELAVRRAPITAAEPEAFLAQLEHVIDARLAERARSTIDIPAAGRPAAVDKGRWMKAVLNHLAGERIGDLETRALADVITTGNEGVVPVQVRTELIGIIDPARPFLESTREVPAGDTGLEMQFPKITQRPVVGVQAAEKDELASQATIITTQTFGSETVGGAGDLSLQLLRRSSPSFLNLWLELLAEQYALKADDLAVDALLAEAAVVEGGVFDPEAPAFGAAFTNAAAVSKSPLLRPDRIWMSTAALAAFIDAKTPTGGGGTAMYPGLASISGVQAAGGGAGPAGISLRPVWVPSLDDEAVDVIVGPSRGFAWAEDGTFTLQADVPAKLGRDVALAGILFFMPIYPAAFTSYTLPI